MLEKLSGPLKQFLGFVGGISATLTTLITATGFLAVRAHLVMLGLSSATFDLQQYLEVGARFLAYLPIFLGIAFLSLGLETLVRGIDFLVEHPFVSASFLAAWAGSLVFRRRARRRSPDDNAPSRLDARLTALRKRRAALLENVWQHPGWLAGFLAVQFLGAYQLTQALEVHNLLFAVPGSVSEIPHTALSLVGTGTLTRWIRDGETIRASQYLGWLFLITMLTAWWLHRVLTAYRATEEPRPWQLVWLAAGMMLFITQITLLPVNYGILLSSNQFPEVSLTYRDLPLEARPADVRLALLRETDDVYYVYAPSERKIWSISRTDVRTLRYHGMIHVLRLPADVSPRE
ncbi:hypothetical protein [Rhodocaloribacter sp.]